MFEMSPDIVFCGPTAQTRQAHVPQPVSVGRIRGRAPLRAARLIDEAVAIAGLAQPLVMVSGFWRSGTTWLQECLAESLGAKTVFEPLSPKQPGWDHILAAHLPPNPDLREAYIPGPLSAGDPAWRYLDRAVLGRGADGFGMACRRTVAESLRTGIVLKDVRLQANLAAVHERYGIPVVHVRRRPAAVVASLLIADWGWGFDQVRLADLLAGLGVDKVQREAARPFDTDPLSRIAAYWAVTERLVHRNISGKSWACVLGYEAAVTAPHTLMSFLCRFVGRPQRRRPRADDDSPVTHPEVRRMDKSLRAERWRRGLSPVDIARIETIVGSLYPEAAMHS